LATGANVQIADIVAGLTRPELAPMPSRKDPVPMPERQTLEMADA